MPANDLALDLPLAADLDLIRDAAREAGVIAMQHFRSDPEVWMKGGRSPVSAADIAVDDFLRHTLLRARPDYGWLSEETADNPSRLSARRTFVVDPIDGTRAFIEGRRTWCVSIAIVESGAAIAGVLDCPARDEIYEATAGGAALLNGAPVRVRAPDAPALIAGPKPMLDRAAAHLAPFHRAPYVPSLAYRIAMIAAGALDGTFVKADAHDWDIAAADLILARAGGRLLDAAGRPLVYATSEPRHGTLVAGSGTLLEGMSAALSKLAE